MLGKFVVIFIFIKLGLARKRGCQHKIKGADRKKPTISIVIGRELSIVFLLFYQYSKTRIQEHVD